MANIHWSQNAHTVKILGVNAIVLVPLLCWLLRMTSVFMFLIFILTLIFFIVVENILGLQARYLPYYIRYNIIGASRAPKTRIIDL